MGHIKLEKTGSLNQSLLWFGAAVSIAEILTGALLAPLGFSKALWAIVIGHLIGGAIFYWAGYIGAKSGLSAIESTRISFGRYGSFWFSLLNVVQLLGWTAVMIVNGAKALDVATPRIQNQGLWCAVIGGLICVWILVGMKNLTKINLFAVGALFLFLVILGFTVFRGGAARSAPPAGGMSFGAAVELSVTMPLSWLPLISDYTRTVKNPRTGTAAGAVAYTAGSSVMYIIGLGAALFAGTDDIAQILVSAGLGIVALLIVILSTVTTTFLDAYSGGVSLGNLSPKINEKFAALCVCVIGTLAAVFVNIGQYENFLYFIGSVFAPLFAVLITDYFILRVRAIDEHARLNVRNFVIWAMGFGGYHLLLRFDSPVGTTLPIMLGVSMACVVSHKIAQKLPMNQKERGFDNV